MLRQNKTNEEIENFPIGDNFNYPNLTPREQSRLDAMLDDASRENYMFPDWKLDRALKRTAYEFFKTIGKYPQER